MPPHVESGRQSPEHRVLVCGSTEFQDQALLFEALDRRHAEKHIDLMIHGCARGADTLGGKWAQARGVPVRRFPARWGRLGLRAGPDRNQRMLLQGEPTLVIAFGGDRGTGNMILQAMRAGVPVEREGVEDVA